MKKSKPLNLSAVSPGVRALNPHLYKATGGPIPGVCRPVEPLLHDLGPLGVEEGKKAKKEKKMSASEKFMEAYLRSKLRDGEIMDWKYEDVTLRLGDDCRYTPDFFVQMVNRLVFIEMKGKKKWEDSIIKFKTAKTIFPCFDFEMWEYTRGEGLKKLH